MTITEYKAIIAESKPKRANRRHLENQIRKMLSNYLTAIGVPHTITEAAAARSQSGAYISGKVDPSWPDISGTIPAKVSPLLAGRSLYIEVKTDDGKLNPGRLVKRGWHVSRIRSQKEVLEELRSAGAIALVARSIDDVTAGLRLAEDAIRRGVPLVDALPELK